MVALDFTLQICKRFYCFVLFSYYEKNSKNLTKVSYVFNTVPIPDRTAGNHSPIYRGNLGRLQESH